MTGKAAEIRFGMSARVFALCVAACSCGSRTTETLLTCPSPDGKREAVFYWVYGGGAAGWAYFRVVVQPHARVLDPDKFFFEMAHGYDVRIAWKSSTELTVEYPDQADVRFHRETVDVPVDAAALSSIQISYKRVPTVSEYSIAGGRKCSTTADQH